MSAHTENQIVIGAPLQLVWEVANDIERWPDLFVDEYARAEVLEREGHRVRFRLTTVPAEDGTVHSWVSERHLDPERGVVTARRIEPGPFRYVHIFQAFTAVEGGTRVRWVQDFEAAPWAPFTDAQARERIDAHTKVNLERHRQVIEALAARAAAAARG